jgi:HEPN domain-containing protein
VAIPSSKNARLFYRTAEQRFDDAKWLFELNRTTGAVYLAGYSVECMLKSLILSTVPRARENDMLDMFRGGRAHDYEWLVRLYQENGGASYPPHLVPHLARVNSWSTDMRYLPGTIQADEAAAFLDSVTAIIKWADGRL